MFHKSILGFYYKMWAKQIKFIKIPIIYKFKLVKKYLTNSKRPVLILGGGIKYSRSEKIINKVVKKIKFPIVSTWSGCDLIDHNNINYLNLCLY